MVTLFSIVGVVVVFAGMIVVLVDGKEDLSSKVLKIMLAVSSVALVVTLGACCVASYRLFEGCTVVELNNPNYWLPIALLAMFTLGNIVSVVHIVRILHKRKCLARKS